MNPTKSCKLQREDFIHALEEIDTFVDITVDDLMDVKNRAEKYARKREAENHPVKDIMTTPVITLNEHHKLSEVANIMVTQRISGIPIVDDQKKLIGLITEADLLRSLGLSDLNPSRSLWQSLENMFSHHYEIQDNNGLVSDRMTRHVITILPQQSLHDALNLMSKHVIKRIIVCDEQRYVLGMITRTDLVRVFFKNVHKNLNTDS